MKDIRLTFLVIALSTLLAACGSSGGGSASFDYSGTWTGTIQDSVAGQGNVTLTMTQNGDDLAGTWESTFAEGTNGGSAVGVVNGNEVVLELHPSQATACPYNVVATRSGDTLSGNYSAFNCTANVTGTLTISK